MKPIDILDKNRFKTISANGADVLFHFDNYRLIDTEDANGDQHHIVVDGNVEPEVYYELCLRDFHYLCSYYLMALQPRYSQALNTLRGELDELSGKRTGLL